jgi:tRNA pseudouridine55 synthase
MNKVILIDKQKDWTSFDVVAKVRSQVRSYAQDQTAEGEKPQKIKVGHAGTLDPLATGLLIVLVGAATKRQDSYMKQDKVYEVEAMLGKTSTTGDEEGEKTEISDVQPTLEVVTEALQSFVGNISQIPPIFSAIKVDGQRAYKLARAGKPVKMKSRNVTIYSIDKITYNYPVVTFTVKVSSGTYIRTLVADIGSRLSTGAYMSNLRRTQIGSASIDDAVPIDDIGKILSTSVE